MSGVSTTTCNTHKATIIFTLALAQLIQTMTHYVQLLARSMQ